MNIENVEVFKERLSVKIQDIRTKYEPEQCVEIINVFEDLSKAHPSTIAQGEFQQQVEEKLGTNVTDFSQEVANLLVDFKFHIGSKRFDEVCEEVAKALLILGDPAKSNVPSSWNIHSFETNLMESVVWRNDEDMSLIEWTLTLFGLYRPPSVLDVAIDYIKNNQHLVVIFLLQMARDTLMREISK